MLRRFNTGFEDGKFSFVAGHVEEGESFANAAVREAFEEVGVKIDQDKLEFFHFLHRKTSVDERADMFFSVSEWEGEIVNAEPLKCDQLEWFTNETVPENTIDYILHVLEQGGANVPVSYFS